MKKLSYRSARHGRLQKQYEKGETPSMYGIARQREDGVYEFISEYGEFYTNYANVWRDPPDHYLVKKGKKIHADAFIVNFNKPNTPQPLKGILR
jgi:hypothetical protein